MMKLIIILLTSLMNLISSLQKQYDQLWKYIIRPARVPYNEKDLGSVLFRYQGVEVQRKDFCLTNSRGYQFSCSLWLPIKIQRAHCVIYLHGNSSNRLEGIDYLGNLIVEGFGLCTFDFCGCGNSGGEYISLGYYQQEDLKLVIQYLKIYPRIDGLALWGRSMGAVTALLYLPKDNSVSAVVLDSPFKSFKGLVEDMAAKTTKVPSIILSAALKIVNITIQQKGKFSLYKLDPLKLTAPKIFIPAFFIVGMEDQVIPIQHTGQLLEAYGSDDKTIRMVNGGHNDNRPDIIVDQVIQFLKDRMRGLKKQKEINEKCIIQEIVTKSQEKDDTFSPVKKQQIKKIEQAVNKGDFSWSKLFSVFTKGQQKNETPKEKAQNKLPKEKTKQTSQCNSPTKKQKKLKKEQPKPQSSEYQASLQEKIRQYSYCYL